MNRVVLLWLLPELCHFLLQEATQAEDYSQRSLFDNLKPPLEKNLLKKNLKSQPLDKDRICPEQSSLVAKQTSWMGPQVYGTIGVRSFHRKPDGPLLCRAIAKNRGPIHSRVKA